VSKGIVLIMLQDEDGNVTNVQDPDQDLTPRQIVDAIMQLDPDDIDDIQKELNYRQGLKNSSEWNGSTL
jgi:hypothetical protein